jgi:hypothetical protein
LEVEGTGADNEEAGRGEGCPNSAISIRYGKISVGMAVARPSMFVFWDYQISVWVNYSHKESRDQRYQGLILLIDERLRLHLVKP